MFSGIVDAIGEVMRIEPSPGGKVLVVGAPGYWSDVAPGASVAVDGVCLTVTERDGEHARFDVIVETLRVTTLGDCRPGGRVNLQKSLAVGERIDGHFVQGHVDATAVVERVERAGGEAKWWFRPDFRVMEYIIPKGGVAIDGISLTVVDVAGGLFSVALIPTTLERTTLGGKMPGARVNVESDILTRTVVWHLRQVRSSQ